MRLLISVLFLAPCLSLASIQFEILPDPEGMFSVRSMNSYGAVAGRTSAGIRIVQNGNVTDVENGSSGNLQVGNFSLADNGWLVGRAGSFGQFSTFIPCAWSPTAGWRFSQAFDQADAVGATADGRVLVREGYAGFRSYWWRPETGDITSIYNNLGLNEAWACNLAGDAIINISPARYVRADGSLVQPTFGDTGPLIYGLSSSGELAGRSGFGGSGASQAFAVVWNRNGEVIRSVSVGQDGGLRSVNSSGEAVGHVGTNGIPVATYWGTSGGLINMEASLLPQFAGYKLRFGRTIANNGLMLVEGYRPGETITRNFLVRAVPEPASLTALGLGMILLRRRLRKAR